MNEYSRGIGQVLAGAVLISFAAVFVKLTTVPAVISAFYRVGIGGVILLALALLKRERLWMGPRPALLALAAGVFFALDLAFWHRSIAYVGPGLATILANFQVFILAGFGVLVLHERGSWRLVAAVPL
ncbi:MAG TPA: EamA family transporter, partial [Gemmatimonadales bacterium]|nr:EamA family transporter [Gemmatimonadales bacterium]